MPPLNLALPNAERIGAFDKRYGRTGAGPLFSWAARCVESLHYLADLDQMIAAEDRPFGHQPDMVDVAHARWATGAAMTALDLVAAGLGRAFCGREGEEKEVSIAWLAPGARDADELRAPIPERALDWVDAVIDDTQYEEIKDARDWLTHSRLTRHFRLGGRGRERLELGLAGGRIDVRAVIEHARDVATRHVTAFLGLLPSL